MENLRAPTPTVAPGQCITLRVKLDHRPRVVVRVDCGGRVGQGESRLLAEQAKWSEPEHSCLAEFTPPLTCIQKPSAAVATVGRSVSCRTEAVACDWSRATIGPTGTCKPAGRHQ